MIFQIGQGPFIDKYSNIQMIFRIGQGQFKKRLLKYLNVILDRTRAIYK